MAKNEKGQTKLWLEFILSVCRLIEPTLMADLSQITRIHGTSVVGYFDYYTNYTNGYLNCSHGISWSFFGESGLQYEREGEDYLNINVRRLKDSFIKSKLFFKNKGVADLEIKATKEKILEMETYLVGIIG
ncbi:MAG: hypothetical protein U0W24_26410 [Bacteroidales bacterium]